MSSIQIIATIGPSSKESGVIADMIRAGMSCARLNFSWGTHEEHALFAERIRTEAESLGVAVPIIQDLSGPRVQQAKGHTYDVSLPAITHKDIHDLEFASVNRPEYIALSFVRSADDISQLRHLLQERGISAKIIAKIERAEALEALDGIIANADGIMIARGDLGEAVPFETVPFIKKDILMKCIQAGKPAVVATEMLTSMTHDADPSRADVSDIAQAVLDGASATMLSNETAVGDFPVEAVKVMRTVVDEALKNSIVASLARF